MSRYHVSGDVKIVPRTSGYERRRGIGFDAEPRSAVWRLSTDSGEPNSGRLQGQPLRDLMAKVIDLDKNYQKLLAAVVAGRRADALAAEEAEAEAERQRLLAKAERRDFFLRVSAALTTAGFTAGEISRVCIIHGPART